LFNLALETFFIIASVAIVFLVSSTMKRQALLKAEPEARII